MNSSKLLQKNFFFCVCFCFWRFLGYTHEQEYNLIYIYAIYFEHIAVAVGKYLFFFLFFQQDNNKSRVSTENPLSTILCLIYSFPYVRIPTARAYKSPNVFLFFFPRNALMLPSLVIHTRTRNTFLCVV